MQVTLYKTFLCPRCFLAGHALKKLQKEFPELTIETVEVTREPLRAWQDGVRLVPAVRYQGKTLSGLLLNTATLRDFIRA
jgi:hypothetical protein